MEGILSKFIVFVRETRPTMVNHGDKINLFELERYARRFVEDEKKKGNKIVDGICCLCGDDAETKDGWICKDCKQF
jgi:hypothetical protein